MKLVRGVGYNSGGKHASHNVRVPTIVYGVWANMLARCYCAKTQENQPTYIGCTVCSEWLDFQVFAEWYNNHEFYGEKYHLDKDLLFKGNKIYSPETCCLIPHELNLLLADNSTRRGEHPQGVCWNKQKKRYQANISIKGRAKHLGRFDTAQEAHQVYVVAKENYVKAMALEWKDKISPRVFNALMNWRLK